jgi:hypothetical protein
MKIFNVVTSFGSLSLVGTTKCMQTFIVLKLKLEIEPLPSYYINCLELGDLFVYKVPLRLHPWGVNFILIKPKIYHCNFKNFCFCLKKVNWVLKAYVHIGGWWILVSLNESKMQRLDQVYVFSYL